MRRPAAQKRQPLNMRKPQMIEQKTKQPPPPQRITYHSTVQPPQLSPPPPPPPPPLLACLACPAPAAESDCTKHPLTPPPHTTHWRHRSWCWCIAPHTYSHKLDWLAHVGDNHFPASCAGHAVVLMAKQHTADSSRCICVWMCVDVWVCEEAAPSPLPLPPSLPLSLSLSPSVEPVPSISGT